MDVTPSGSFIPKRNSQPKPSVRSNKRIYLFSYLSYIVFFGTLLSVIGIYLLNQQAERKLEDSIVAVEQARTSFNQEQISAIVDFEERLNVAQELINTQLSVSELLGLLEGVVLRSVQLNTFSYTKNDAGGPLMSVSAVADDFDSVLFQRMTLAEDEVFATAAVSGVAFGSVANELGDGSAAASVRTDSEAVTFTISKYFTAEEIGYGELPVAVPAPEAATPQPAPADEVAPESAPEVSADTETDTTDAETVEDNEVMPE